MLNQQHSTPATCNDRCREPSILTFPQSENRVQRLIELTLTRLPYVVLPLAYMLPIVLFSFQKWTSGTLLCLGLPVSLICMVVHGPPILRYWNHRLILRTLANHSDPVIAPYDPEAIFVSVMPKNDWWIVSSAASNTETQPKVVVPNLGLLQADLPNRLLLLESIRERWVIPGECLRDVRIINPSIGLLGVAFAIRFQKVWHEVLVCVKRTRSYPFTYSAHRDAEHLRSLIGHLADPTKWPTVSPQVRELMHQPDDE